MNIVKLKNGKTIRLNSIKSNEFFVLLKLNILMKIVFFNPKTQKFLDKFYILSDRTISNNKQVITVNKNVLDYKTLISEISNLQSEGFQLMIELSTLDFKNKLYPFVNIMDKIKLEILKSCVYIDYNNKIYSIVYPKLSNGASAKLYYFEETNSVLGFSEEGPMLIQDSNKINSIEDLIC